MTAPLACVTGTIHRLGDNVDTDAILPGRYLALRGRTWKAQPLAGEVAAILACGGLMERTRALLSARAANDAVEPGVRWPDRRAWGADVPASSGEESR